MTIAVVVMLALVGASCGGDSETASDTDTVVTETEGITAEETTTDDDDGFATGECASLVEASTSAATVFSGTATRGEVDEAKERFEEFAENAPDEIQDDLQVLADAYGKYADELADVNVEPGEAPDAEAIEELQDALASIDQSEVTVAAANVNAWTTANC